jgi:hypothetical protein
MTLIKHSFVAHLKERYPKVASSLSRVYALTAARRNRSIAARAEDRPLIGTTFWSIVRQENVAPADVPEAILGGDVIIARGLVDALGIRDDFDGFLGRAYGIGYDDAGRIHEKVSTPEIAERTERFKNDPGLLTLECTILQSLFPHERELYVELMPNLRPHLPHHMVLEHESAIEEKIGRGKMNPHGPHKDSWRFHPENTINVWLALSDVNHLNGMFILPKSRDYYPKFANNEIRIGCQTYPGQQYLTDLRAGDAVLFAAELLHGSVINQTPATRFAFSMRCSFEKPRFHKTFMYNYVRVKPSFSNLIAAKLKPNSDFEPPSRDTESPSLGGLPPHIDIVSMTPEQLVVRVGEELVTYPRRCPHQGMDLRHGYLDGNRLVCPQHQMRVDGISRCPFAAETTGASS